MINFTIATPKDFQKMADFASQVWHETYDPILGNEQVNYMLDKFQSVSAFARQITSEGYTYYLINDESGFMGYIALVDESPKKLYMSKLYLHPSARGKGYARLALSLACDKGKQLNKSVVYLTVNKANTRAIAVYENCGFVRVNSVKADIGNDYFMDDYVYEKNL